MKVALGLKKGMTQVFVEDKVVPVTIVELADCVVARKDTKGFELGLGKIKAGKALSGKYKELNYVPRYRAYFNGDSLKNVGDKLEATLFEESDIVLVKGVAKGKGFTGVVKRWGFAGGPKTHGQSDRERAPGSIGSGTDPGRIWKNQKMAGRTGSNNVTLKNKKIVKVFDNCVLVSGPVPGNNGDLVIISAQE